MEIEVNIKSSDILSEDEIKDIVSSELKKATREYFINNPKNGASNMAFYIKENILQEQLEEHIDEMKLKFKEQLDKFSFSSYDVDKNNRLSKMMEEQVDENENKIKAKAQQYIDERLNDDFYDSWNVADKIAEAYKEVVVEAIHSKFKG
jgi:hypothetical protein